MKWLGKLLSSASPRPEAHVSIWSVTAPDAKTFFRIAGALWVVAVAFIVYKTVDSTMRADGAPEQEVWRNIGDFTLEVLAEFGTVALAIAIAILLMLLTRVVNTIGEILMSLYQAMVNRFVIPVIEAHKAEGREKGRTEVMEEWRAWNKRRLEAEREGREFDQSPPGDAPLKAGS